jgi:putative transposase
MGSLSADGHTAEAEHSLSDHLVWRPKYRRPMRGGLVAERCRVLVAARCAEEAWTVWVAAVPPNPIRLVARCGPDISCARIAHQVKGTTSRAMRHESPHLRSRLPTRCSTVSLIASVGTIRRSIAEQTTNPTKGAP